MVRVAGGALPALTEWWLQGGSKVSEAKVIYQELSEKLTSTVRTKS